MGGAFPDPKLNETFEYAEEALEDGCDGKVTTTQPLPMLKPLFKGKHGWVIWCKNLGRDGRCTDYANRPDLCRSFEPGSDRLCCLHPDSKDFTGQTLPLLTYEPKENLDAEAGVGIATEGA